jgi:hypothetical protein
MDDRKITVTTQPVIFELIDGSKIDGEVYLRLHEARHTGPQKVGDLLNEPLSFIPVKTDRGHILLNASQIVSVSVDLVPEKTDLLTLGKRYAVRIKTILQQEIRGEIFVNLPEESSRIKDYFNQPCRFSPLFQPALVVYVNRHFILSVQE